MATIKGEQYVLNEITNFWDLYYAVTSADVIVETTNHKILTSIERGLISDFLTTFNAENKLVKLDSNGKINDNLITAKALENLSNVEITNLQPTEFLRFMDGVWKNVSVTTINTTNSTAAFPPEAVNGNLWWDSNTGRLKVYYDDGYTKQWVDALPTSTGASSIYIPFTGATEIADGGEGLVPQPLITDRNRFLKGNGAWEDLFIDIDQIRTEFIKALKKRYKEVTKTNGQVTQVVIWEDDSKLNLLFTKTITYDLEGRVSEVSTTDHTATKTLVKNLTYIDVNTFSINEEII